MTTVLITAIGGDIAQGVATIIRESYPDWRIIGTDLHERHGGRLFTDEFFVAPPASDELYEEWLCKLVVEQNADFCVPMSEPELGRISHSKQRQFRNAVFIMPNRRAIEVGADKLATAQFLDSLKCPRPWTVSAGVSDLDIPLPCVFKPRRGSGSKSVFVCRTTKEMCFYRDLYPEGVFQELLLPEKKEITCAVYRTRRGEIFVLQLLRTLVGGLTGWARVVSVPEILDQCRKIATALDLEGAINVQLRLTDSGPRIFEINARFSSTVLMRHRMGFCDVVWSIEESMQNHVDYKLPEVGTTAARTQGAALLCRANQRFSS